MNHILLWPDPKLKQKSREVNFFETGHFNNGPVMDLILKMDRLMSGAGGVGLSAIQIGVPDQIFIVRVAPHQISTWVNPKIVARSKEMVEVEEGCLSLPGVFERVKRHAWIEVDGLDWEGNSKDHTRLEGGQGSHCHIFQHEFDHLQGITIPDRLGPGGKDRIRAKMRRR